MKYVVVILAALVLVLGIQVLGRADAPEGVKKWEYKAERTVRDEPTLNMYGKEGWEFVGLGDKFWIFKRPLN